jgi:hypothetical protein
MLFYALYSPAIVYYLLVKLLGDVGYIFCYAVELSTHELHLLFLSLALSQPVLLL